MTSPAPTSRTDGIVAASRRKAEAAEKATRAAITKLRRAGTPITIAAVAREARVSQHYLHQHPELGPLIRSIRNTGSAGAEPPATEPPSTSGIVSVLRARIQTQADERRELLQRISALESEIQTLRGALAQAQSRGMGPDARAR